MISDVLLRGKDGDRRGAEVRGFGVFVGVQGSGVEGRSSQFQNFGL